MPRYFLDTSALAKVYRRELGSDLIDRVVSEPGSDRFISRFTILEMESVLALKFRTGEIDGQALVIARRRLDADLGSGSSGSHRSTTSTCEKLGDFLSTMDEPRRCAARTCCNWLWHSDSGEPV